MGRRAQRFRLWLATGELRPAPPDEFAMLITEVARQHGVAGLLHDAIVDQGRDWSRAACAILRQTLQDVFTLGVRQLDTASRVQDILSAAGVRCVPLKGAALAESYYDSIAHRPMEDVDLLVLDDWHRAVRLVKAAGLREEYKADHAIAFLDPALGVAVELHRGVTSCSALFPLDLEATWRRCRIAAGQVRTVPSGEDLLVHLSLHATFQHGLGLRLVQWLDFRRLLERNRPDPAVIGQIAADPLTRRAVALALEAARAVVAAPVEPELRKLIAAWVPVRLGRFILRTQDDAAIVLAPGQPPLAWIRWQLAAGRRWMLVRETLRPRVASAPEFRTGATARTLRLARRWALPTLRSLRATPWN